MAVSVSGSQLNPQLSGISLKYVVMGDPWLSVEQIAAHLGIKPDTVYKWISRYQMPAHNVGRLWKFQLNEVDAWVRSRESASETHKE